MKNPITYLLVRQRMKEEQMDACRKHAARYGATSLFELAYRYCGNMLGALEDCDLLNEEIINKLDAIRERYDN